MSRVVVADQRFCAGVIKSLSFGVGTAAIHLDAIHERRSDRINVYGKSLQVTACCLENCPSERAFLILQSPYQLETSFKRRFFELLSKFYMIQERAGLCAIVYGVMENLIKNAI